MLLRPEDFGGFTSNIRNFGVYRPQLEFFLSSMESVKMV